MFIKTIVKTDKKSGKRYDYYRLAEGFRIGNKVRHRTIISMGKLEGIESREDKKMLADLIESLIKGERQLFALKVKPEIERYAKLFAKRIIDQKLLDISPAKDPLTQQGAVESDFENIDINSIKHEEAREIGPEWLCKQAMEQLGLRNILEKKCNFSTQAANLALTHILSRAVLPCF